MKSIVKTKLLEKIYGENETEVIALDKVDIEFLEGQFTAIMGPSGSGKSTLLHCLAGLDGPTSGSIYINNIDLSKLNDKQLTKLRRDSFGFVFQAFNLIPTLTAAENISLPSSIAGNSPEEEWLEKIIQTLTSNPAKILKINKGNLTIGNDADFCIVDINKPWIVKKEKLISKSKNTSIENKKLQGKITNTFVKGVELFKL